MKTKDAINHFGSVTRLANKLGITRHAVYLWGDLVPEGRAYQLEVLTKGKLKVSSAAVKHN
jgi:hypothetical protein